MTNKDPRDLIRKAQQQTSANRYAFLVRQINAKLIDKIKTR